MMPQLSDMIVLSSKFLNPALSLHGQSCLKNRGLLAPTKEDQNLVFIAILEEKLGLREAGPLKEFSASPMSPWLPICTGTISSSPLSYSNRYIAPTKKDCSTRGKVLNLVLLKGR